MEEVIRLQDQYYILAASSRADDRTRVLKHGNTFAVFDRYGDIVPFGLGEQGLYHAGTRHLSVLDLRLNGKRPLLLSSTVREDNDLFVVDLTNPDIPIGDDAVFRRDVLHLFRSKFLLESVCYERLRLTNYGRDALTLALSLRCNADFADIFEVRGTRRNRRGRLLPPVFNAGTLVLEYIGLDDIVRRTRIEWSPAPTAMTMTGDEAMFEIALPPQESVTLLCTVSCEAEQKTGALTSFEEAFSALRSALTTRRAERPHIETANQEFNAWISRSTADLEMMMTATPHGIYPYAGVPWFSTPFGRDGIISALELLWIDPSVARGVLSYLASTQATEVNPLQEAEPGKILHETRGGEMAALGEIPFGRYYGSVDATPLFVVLAGEYHERTADRAFIESIWPNVEAALGWIDTYGDPDRDGLVEYMRKSPDGLVHQGWKDSQDSVFHADGTLAEPPFALCEVQAYVYLAKRRAAELSLVLGHERQAADFLADAERLRERFEALFWCDELSTYALALDGMKQPCRVRTSNAGHCLFGQIASPQRAAATVRTLVANDMFSGWGIRTVGALQARYNPMSYHNGSVWPHDNAVIARGCAQYGLTTAVATVFRGLFDLSLFVDLTRMPELVCGFERRPGEGPTLYPVACAPQSWAAAALFMLLQSSLGLAIRAPQQRLVFERALLPDFLPWVRILNLRVGDASVDLLIERHEFDVGIRVLRRSGDVEIIAVK
jgi:glycogen debranching enzyme